jgi:hypothetical protein
LLGRTSDAVAWHAFGVATARIDTARIDTARIDTVGGYAAAGDAVAWDADSRDASDNASDNASDSASDSASDDASDSATGSLAAVRRSAEVRRSRWVRFVALHPVRPLQELRARLQGRERR